MDEQDQYDELFTQIAGRIGNVKGLLHSFFGFLHRKTDFYVEFDKSDVNATMGFPKGVAESLVMSSFRKYKMKEYPMMRSSNKKVSSGDLPPPPENQTPGSGNTLKNDDTAAVATKLQSTSIEQSNSPSTPIAVQMNDKGQQIPIGNGGICPNYYWTQTLADVTVYIDANKCNKGKDVICAISAKSLKLSMLGEVVIDGELEEPVRVDESMWTLNVDPQGKQSQVVITLDKTRKTWWKHVIVGDPEIDTTKVDSTQRIDEFDEKTQATIRKLMFDQQQKRLGMPTSEEIQMEAIMEKAKHAPGSPFL